MKLFLERDIILNNKNSPKIADLLDKDLVDQKEKN
jgi:hypothetical protein